MSQEQFADALGVKRLAVSTWESKSSEPSAGGLVKLAKLAQGRGFFDVAFRFWELMGVTPSVLRALVPKIDAFFKQHERRTFEPSPEADVVRLPLLESSFFEGNSDDLIARLNPIGFATFSGEKAFVSVPSSFMAHPRSTVAVRAPSDYMRPLFRRGDFVVMEVPFRIPNEAPAKRVGQAPIAALYFKPEHPDSSAPRPGLHLREVYLYGPELKQMRLDTAVGRGIAASRAFFKGGLDFDVREEIESASIRVDYKNESDWSIIGRVIGWLGTDREPSSEREAG